MTSERMFFTFRSNGNNGTDELVEATIEKLDVHEPPVGDAAQKQSWFGTAERLQGALVAVGFSDIDIEGVLSTLRVNKVATREVASTTAALSEAGFATVL